jgi:uncharacterized membrane protein
MIVLFIIIGIVAGGIFWGINGAITLGFIGWLTGLIVKAQRHPVEPPAAAGPAPAARPLDPVEARLAALEKRYAALEARVTRFEGGAPAADIAMTREEPQPPQPLPSAPPPKPVPVTPPPVPTARAPEIAKAPVAAQPPIEAKPNFIVAWFTGGNTIVRVGLVILFVGLAFLIKYGVEHQLVPVELRVAAVAAAGVVLLVIGWRLRLARPGYALSLQGAAVAILYLTIFGVLRLYGLLPPALAFAMLVAIAVLSAMLAIGQDSLALAAFGVAGGFLAPILASTGHGNHVMLFSYYLVLNGGIVTIAWFKAWRALNIIGFLFTALIGLAWGLRSYRPELFDSTEPFLVAFFLVYVAIAVLFARRQVQSLRNYVDGTIVFGTPIFAFGLQAGLMRGTEYGLAFSSLAAAALYLGLAATLHRIGHERWRLLVESFLALGVVFVTLAIPLALDARWTSAAWALEGAALVWIGARQGRVLARAFGIFLELAAGFAFLDASSRMPSGPPLADAPFVGAMLLALAGLATYRLLARGHKVTAAETGLAPLAFLWGLGWWLYAGLHEIRTFVDEPYRINSVVTFVAATALAYSMVGTRRDWREGQWPFAGLAPVLFLLAAASFATQAHPLANLGWIAWPFAIGVHYALLRQEKLEGYGRWPELLHVAGVILIAVLGTLELEWFAAENTARGTAWALASRIVVPALLILLLSSRAADSRWPVAAHTAAYRVGAVLLLIVAMGVWSLHVNVSHAGRSDPLPYLPLLNALDLAHVLAILAIVSAWLAMRRSTLEPPKIFTDRVAIAIAGALAFVWVNAMLLRTIHHWYDVPYRVDAMARSVLVQASLSVFWAFLALALMVIATRRAKRALWIVGASLMGVVVAKLALVDFSHLSGIERIVSFIGVGVLMLVIGYFSPVPPRQAEVSP